MTTTPTSGAADLPEALHRVIDEFEQRERGIPQARIAAALVAELRSTLHTLAAGQAVAPVELTPDEGFFLLLPKRPKPEAPANTVGLTWDAYSGAQMLAYGRECSDAARPAPPAMDSGEDAERWEFRWLNPANKQNVAPSELAWKTVNSKGMRSEKEVLEDLKTYRYQGKPVYELRPLFATRALQKPEIRCPVRLANGGDCPRHNLQCGWPDCNKETK